MRDFAASIALYINEYTEFEGRVVEKNMPDGSVRYGVSIKRPEENISPTIYVESFYNDCLTVEDAATKIIQIYEDTKVDMPDVGFMTDFEKVKDMLTVRLLPSTFKTEIFRSAKRYGFDDLILVPYIDLGDILGKGQGGSVLVRQQLISGWGVTKKEVIDTAIKNTKSEKAFVQSLNSFMTEMTGMEMDEIPGGPVIITNEKKTYGASAILGQLTKLKKANDGGFFVLPSSIHEVLVLPKMGNDKESLDAMVREVNMTQVSPEEQLANHAYEF